MKYIFIVICAISAVIADSQHPEVNAPIGRIIGSIIDSRLGKKIFSFRGIRYAEPPIGKYRFQVPVPAEDWMDAFNATTEGPGCPHLSGKIISEDCLRLNVYTTLLPFNITHEKATRRPVFVFIHPGGFYSFSGQSYYYGPQYLMDQEIVLVTLNYRLGTLGFISTGDSLAPGNLGLKDQVVALRWVQRNIAAFGGDPQLVTISGYNVGALSVILHMVSPMSVGLFHRAISMSGSTLINEPFPTEQINLAKKQAVLLNCPIQPNKIMLECLRERPVKNYTDTLVKFFEWGGGDPVVIWKPVVEPDVPGVERFLPAQPVDLIKQGKINQVPLIAGVTKDELGGVIVAYDRVYRHGIQRFIGNLNRNWDTVAPIIGMYERGTCRSRYISQELRQFYFQDQRVGPNTYKGLAEMYADSVVIFPQYRTVQLFAQHMAKPVYFYRFSYQGRRSFSMWNQTAPYGIVHHDDLQYLFYISTVFPFLSNDDPEVEMLELYSSMWANFASTGYPVPDTVGFEDVIWSKYSVINDNYLDINQHPKMKKGLYTNRMQIWNKLFPVHRQQPAQCKAEL